MSGRGSIGKPHSGLLSLHGQAGQRCVSSPFRVRLSLQKIVQIFNSFIPFMNPPDSRWPQSKNQEDACTSVSQFIPHTTICKIDNKELYSIHCNDLYWKRISKSCCCFSHSVLSDSLRPHGLRHARPPCPPSTPRACSNSCPSSRWCHPTISSSVVPFSSRLQSFQASGSFLSQFFVSGGQSIGVPASASVLPVNIQDWFPLGWTGYIVSSILFLTSHQEFLVFKEK